VRVKGVVRLELKRGKTPRAGFETPNSIHSVGTIDGGAGMAKNHRQHGRAIQFGLICTGGRKISEFRRGCKGHFRHFRARIAPNK
jgi:hypothetical protein